MTACTNTSAALFWPPTDAGTQLAMRASGARVEVKKKTKKQETKHTGSSMSVLARDALAAVEWIIEHNGSIA